MELRVYDIKLMRLGTVDDATSVRWRPKYYEPGEFEIHVPATLSNILLFDYDEIIADRVNGYSGIIEGIEIEKSRSKREITITGRMISSILDRRIIKGKNIFNGEVEKLMRQIIQLMEPFPGLVLGEYHGYEEKITFQATYKNVLDYMTKLSEAGNIGFRISPDFDKKQYIFETYRGVDHTAKQHENNRVIFSENYNNLEGFTRTKNAKLYKNVMYVGGQGDSNRTITINGDTMVVTDDTADTRKILICGDDSLKGFDRREEFLSATDVTQDENTSESDYEQALIQRGNDKLKDDVMVDSVEGDVSPLGSFQFGKDWNIGDLVTLQMPEWNIEKDERVTEVEVIYEHGNIPTITPTFGTPVPETIDWSDN